MFQSSKTKTNNVWVCGKSAVIAGQAFYALIAVVNTYEEALDVAHGLGAEFTAVQVEVGKSYYDQGKHFGFTGDNTRARFL